jgi:hypothetical protein
MELPATYSSQNYTNYNSQKYTKLSRSDDNNNCKNLCTDVHFSQIMM